MDVFTQKRFTSWVFVLLILLNLSTLYILWSKDKNKSDRPFPPPRERAGNFILFLREELKFRDNQVQDYGQYRNKHAERTRRLMNQVHSLKQEMFNEIFKDEPDSTKANMIAEEIGIIQNQIEKVTFAHFLDLKKLCGTEQTEKLQALIADFNRKNRPPEPPPPNRRRPGGPRPGERPRN